MIIQEKISVDKTEYIRTYSDNNKYVIRNNIEYEEAIDPIDSGRKYTESKNFLPSEPIENIMFILTGYDEISKKEALKFKKLIDDAGIKEKDWKGG